jgi:hypothetical protein
MKIKCLTVFLDGADRFEQDDVRTVSDERGAYFVEQGWAENTDPNAEPVQATESVEVSLDVKSTNNKLGDNHG